MKSSPCKDCPKRDACTAYKRCEPFQAWFVASWRNLAIEHIVVRARYRNYLRLTLHRAAPWRYER